MSVRNNRNLIFYVQRQINHILKGVQHFAKAYIDDIIIKFRLFHDYLTYLRIIFDPFTKYNIFIKLIKVFLDYLNVVLFNQKVNALKLLTTDKKLIFDAKSHRK